MLGSGVLALADCTGQSVAAEDDDDRLIVQKDVPESYEDIIAIIIYK